MLPSTFLSLVIAFGAASTLASPVATLSKGSLPWSLIIPRDTEPGVYRTFRNVDGLQVTERLSAPTNNTLRSSIAARQFTDDSPGSDTGQASWQVACRCADPPIPAGPTDAAQGELATQFQSFRVIEPGNCFYSLAYHDQWNDRYASVVAFACAVDTAQGLDEGLYRRANDEIKQRCGAYVAGTTQYESPGGGLSPIIGYFNHWADENLYNAVVHQHLGDPPRC